MALDFTSALQQVVSLSGLTSLTNVAGWTIMGWMRPRSLTVTRVLLDISGGAGTNTRAAIQIGTTGALSVQARSDDAAALITLSSAAGTVVDGELFHFAGIADYVGKTLQIFKNGVQIANGPAAFTTNTSSNTISNSAFIGADAGGTTGFMEGVIEDCRVYNRILGPAEIITIASQQGQDRILTGMANQYYLNDFPPGIAVVGNGLAIDLGSNQRNGDLVNGPLYVAGTLVFRKRAIASIGSRT